MHWNAAGEIDGYATPLAGALWYTLINLRNSAFTFSHP